MRLRCLLYSGCAAAMLSGLSSCADWMLSGGDLFFDDPYAPVPPVLYNPPLPDFGWGIAPNYYPGWNGPGWNGPVYYPGPGSNRPAPPPSTNPAPRPPQQTAPPQQKPSGQRPGANIIFGDGGSGSGNGIQNRPAGGAGGRH